MNKPLVSVIIPCYNAEKYVEEAIRSIMTQTYSNLEIIVTDDCSSDNTLMILETLAAEDSRIKVIKNEENLRIVKSLNNMIGIAQGKYIARMDADDISLPKRIEKQVSFLESNPEYGMCGTNAWHIDESGRKIGRSYLSISDFEIQRTKFIRCPFYHPTICIRSELIKTNLYDNYYDKVEDFELWLRILPLTKACNLAEKLFYYRKFEGSSSFFYTEEIVSKLTALFYSYLQISYSEAKEYVDYFYIQQKRCNSNKVIEVVVSNFDKINSKVNPICMKKEFVFFIKNKLFVNKFFCKFFYLFFSVKNFFVYFGK